MTKYCPECGHLYEDDSGFCYKCGCDGSKAIVLEDNISNSCSSNGSCGTYPPYPGMSMTIQPRKNSTLIIFVSLFLGFVDVFGIGHLLLKEYAKAAKFLAATAVFLIIRFGMPEILTGNMEMVYLFLTMGVFLYQMLDIFRLCFQPVQKQ